MKTNIVLHVAALLVAAHAPAQVTLVKVPDNALQPKALVDAAGTTHLLSYRGNERGGNLSYATKPAKAPAFGTPVRVNSTPDSAIAVGTIRGGQFALGKNGQAHVVWNGVAARRRQMAPLFYARSKSDGSGFEDQRAMSGDWVMDGGGAVAADPSGNVFVFYHGGNPGERGEDSRRVLVRISHDSGVTFEPEKIISPDGLGVCGCCAMQAYADAGGRWFVVYRTASNGGADRDIATMFSSDHGKTWKHSIASRWRIAMCPMSSMSIAEVGGRVLMAWEKEGQVFASPWDDTAESLGAIIAMPGPSSGRKHPAIASNAAGQILVAWTEGTGWNKGGGAAWQIFDRDLKPVGNTESSPGVDVWSFVAPVPDASGGFALMH
ncbi:MAG: glycoside hydrolase [Verrucomicrobiaceae bacterium]|nr:glycoside hydrolase [Verrucomicrobiaceae bacterium]